MARAWVTHMLCQEMHEVWSWTDASERRAVTPRLASLSPWTGCDSLGEGWQVLACWCPSFQPLSLCVHLVPFWSECLVSNVPFVFVYSFRRSEGGACFFLKEFDAENIQFVDVVLSMRVEGVVEQFSLPFVAIDARVLVRYPYGYGAVSPASLNQVKTNIEDCFAYVRVHVNDCGFFCVCFSKVLVDIWSRTPPRTIRSLFIVLSCPSASCLSIFFCMFLSVSVCSVPYKCRGKPSQVVRTGTCLCRCTCFCLCLVLCMCVVCGVCLCSVAFFGSVGKSAWKPSSKVQQMFETANRYCEGKVQRILNRELSCAGNW